MSFERGKIKHKGRRQQIIDWSGIRYNNITCSDIDGGFDIRGNIFVFCDIKLENAPFENGERWYYEALVNNLKKPAIAIIARHNIFNISQEVPAHECRVDQYYIGKSHDWIKPKNTIKLKEAIDIFLNKHNF